MKKYELTPNDGRKSFYGKAIVVIDDKGGETLYSYGTKIMKRDAAGQFVRFWNEWTATTGRHIKAFSDLNKAQYMELPLV